MNPNAKKKIRPSSSQSPTMGQSLDGKKSILNRTGTGFNKNESFKAEDDKKKMIPIKNIKMLKEKKDKDQAHSIGGLPKPPLHKKN